METTFVFGSNQSVGGCWFAKYGACYNCNEWSQTVFDGMLMFFLCLLCDADGMLRGGGR